VLRANDTASLEGDNDLTNAFAKPKEISLFSDLKLSDDEFKETANDILRNL